MGWPAAHRNGGSIGSQGAWKTPGFPGGVPANDNRPYRPPPPPANDNFPWRPPPPPGGNQFGRRGGREAKRAMRRSPGVRRVLRWMPFAYWVYDWYHYINTTPIATVRYNNAGWVLRDWCGNAITANLNGYASCGEQWVSISPQTADYIRYLWWVDWSRPHGSLPGIYRGAFQQYWRRVSGSVHKDQKWPSQWSSSSAREVEYWLPAVDPFFLPPGVNQPTPASPPRGVSRGQWTYDREGNWSDRGHESRPRPRVAPDYNYKPTPPKTKERKTKVRRAAVFALKQAYMATEAVDAINALHDGVGGMPAALPAQYRSKSDRIQDKAAALYRHWDKIDVEQAVLNLAANQFLDLLVGVPQGMANQWATQHGITTGGALTGVRGI